MVILPMKSFATDPTALSIDRLNRAGYLVKRIRGPFGLCGIGLLPGTGIAVCVVNNAREKIEILVRLLGNLKVRAAAQEMVLQLHHWHNLPDGSKYCEVIEIVPADFTAKRKRRA
jgi:hypothetical protein